MSKKMKLVAMLLIAFFIGCAFTLTWSGIYQLERAGPDLVYRLNKLSGEVYACNYPDPCESLQPSNKLSEKVDDNEEHHYSIISVPND